MAKTGRNDPCPCGSGRKYKQCCLEKDEAQARQEYQARVGEAAAQPWPAGPSPAAVAGEPAAAAPPLLAASSSKDLLDQPLSPEQQAADERWDRFEAAGREERIQIFRETLASSDLDASEAFDMIDRIRLGGSGPEDREAFDALLADFRAQAPAVYHEEAGYFNAWLIEDAFERQQHGQLPELLEPYGDDPVRFIDQFMAIVHQCLYYDQAQPLLGVLRRGWPAVAESSELLPWSVDEFARIVTALTVFEYIGSTPDPRPDDPVLRAALPQGRHLSDEDLQFIVHGLLGHLPVPLRPQDFTRAAGREALARLLERLSVEWLGEIHRHHGVPLARGELARGELVGYLAERRDHGVQGPDLVLPKARLLQRYLERRRRAALFEWYEGIALMELLPLYVEHLVRRDLVRPEQADRALPELNRVQLELREQWKQDGRDPAALEAIDRAWQDVRIV